MGFEGVAGGRCKAVAARMAVAGKGKGRGEADKRMSEFVAMATGRFVPEEGRLIGRLAVFSGISELPMRVKCAILPWHTLQAAFDSVATTSTEADADPMHAPIGDA